MRWLEERLLFFKGLRAAPTLAHFGGPSLHPAFAFAVDQSCPCMGECPCIRLSQVHLTLRASLATAYRLALHRCVLFVGYCSRQSSRKGLREQIIFFSCQSQGCVFCSESSTIPEIELWNGGMLMLPGQLLLP